MPVTGLFVSSILLDTIMDSMIRFCESFSVVVASSCLGSIRIDTETGLAFRRRFWLIAIAGALLCLRRVKT